MNKFLELPTVFLVTAVLVICGCTPTATEETPQIAGASISTLSPLTPTSMPSTPTTKIETTIIGLPTGPGVEWDLVVIGDSTLWKLAEAFASPDRKGCWCERSCSMTSPLVVSPLGKSSDLCDSGDTLTDLPDTLREAEVVVMFVNPFESIDPETSPQPIEACFYYKAPNSCSMESFGKYIADLKSDLGGDH